MNLKSTKFGFDQPIDPNAHHRFIWILYALRKSNLFVILTQISIHDKIYSPDFDSNALDA